MSSNLDLLTTLSGQLADAVERAGAGIVRVNARRRLPASGIALAADRVLTADHVIEREEGIVVGLADGREAPAKLLGRDPGSDLALLQVSDVSLQPAEQAGGEPKVGQIALAVGRPDTDGLQASLGVVSALGGPARTRRGGLLERYIRTDAVLYPGFSGGPLVDAGGRVLAINTSGFGMGLSLAIPIGYAARVAESLLQHGRVRRGYLGVRSQPVAIPPAQQTALGRQQESGLLLLWVEDDSPAARAGLMVGDIIVALDGQPTPDPDALQGALAGKAGQTARLELVRGGRREEIAATVGQA